ncbi:MAG: DUF177 domain-containing protein [Bacteroidia bacterium]|nr:DUF177 domain-containing protein [Bacteroidia bacterium]
MASKDYHLVYGSLKEGLHEFSYHLTEDFFTSIEQELIQKGDVHVLLKLDRSERHLSLDFKLDGWVDKSCDTCLSQLQYPIDSLHHLHVKISDKEMEDEADLIVLGSGEYQLDLTSHLFDFVALSLPMKIECEDPMNSEECDKTVLKMLATEEGDNDKTTHPEWQKLKEIFKN